MPTEKLVYAFHLDAFSCRFHTIRFQNANLMVFLFAFRISPNARNSLCFLLMTLDTGIIHFIVLPWHDQGAARSLIIDHSPSGRAMGCIGMVWVLVQNCISLFLNKGNKAFSSEVSLVPEKILQIAQEQGYGSEVVSKVFDAGIFLISKCCVSHCGVEVLVELFGLPAWAFIAASFSASFAVKWSVLLHELFLHVQLF